MSHIMPGDLVAHCVTGELGICIAIVPTNLIWTTWYTAWVLWADPPPGYHDELIGAGPSEVLNLIQPHVP
jgi:hypothetical protein